MNSRTLLALGFCVASASALAQGRLIALDSSMALVELSMTTGARTPIATVSGGNLNIGALAYDRQSDTLWGVAQANDSLYTIDYTTGVSTLVGAFGANLVVHGLEFDNSTNTLYAMHTLTGTMYTIDKTTGAATPIGSHGITANTNLGYNLNSDVMYATNSSTDSFYTVDRGTGAMTLVGSLGGPTLPNSLAFNHDTNTLYMTDTVLDSLLTVNMATGTTTSVGSTSVGNLQGMVYVNPVPEPATLVVLGLGLAFLVRRNRR